MPKSWATFGQDFFLELDRARVRASLEEGIRQAVRTGRLVHGSSVPSSRQLAKDLHVARNTVVDAYSTLVSEGWLSARSGSRTVVAKDVPTPDVPAPAIVDVYPVTKRYDLRAGWPDLSTFPRRPWLDSARRALDDATARSFGYFEPRGRPELRTALADHLGRTRGVQANPDQIVVCLGAMHGLYLIGSALRAGGATVWASESHGLRVHRDRARGLGFNMRYLPVDAAGAQLDQLGDADAVLLTPANQFPFGVALSAQRREDVVAWSRATGGLVVEDDYDGEFRFDNRAVPALQSLAPDRVVYVGTASKSLAPGLRLGWMVVPPDLLDSVLRAKSLSDGHNSFFDELTFAHYLSGGSYGSHVRRSRRRYEQRRRLLIDALAGFGRIRVTGADAGLHALIQLPAGVGEDEVVASGHRRDLVLEGLSTFRFSRRFDHAPALVVGFGTPDDRAFPETITRLVATLRDCGG